MKRTLVIVVTMLMVGHMGLRAEDQADMERLTAYKIAFFTRKLDLTPSEARNSGRYIMTTLQERARYSSTDYR